MALKFFEWQEHWQTGRRHKVAIETWPTPYSEPCDEVSEFARAYAERWSTDEYFPDYPCRDAKTEQIILPESLDTTPAEYLDANAPPAPPLEAPYRLPMAGPMHIVDNPSNAPGAKAAYEKSRRHLKPLVSKPPPAPYEHPTPPVSSHTPKMGGEPGPAIAPRFYEPDPNHPKYKRRGAHR